MKSIKFIPSLLAAVIALAALTFTSAETIDMTQGGPGPYLAKGRPIIVERTLDFTVQNVVSGDVVIAVNLDANTQVDRVHYSVTTGEGALLTFAIGDSANSTQYVGSVNGSNTTASISVANNAKYYSATNDLRLTVLSGSADTAVVTMKALLTDFGD